MTNFISTIDRFEGDYAVIKTEDSQEILWPKKLLDSELTEGSKVTVTIQPNESLTKTQKQKAKNLLNQILSNQKS